MSRFSLTKSFFVPERMNMEGVGVDLSEVSLRFVKITGNGKKGFDVLNFGEYKIPDGVISLGQIE